MNEYLDLNPMQRSYLHGMDLPDGLFSKACCMYRFSPDLVDTERLHQAIRKLPVVHPLLGASLSGETLIPGAGSMRIREIKSDNRPAEDLAEELFCEFSMDSNCLAEAVMITGDMGYLVFCLNGIIADGVSHQKMIKTLEQLYRGESVLPCLCAKPYLQFIESGKEDFYDETEKETTGSWAAGLPEPISICCSEEMFPPESRESVMRRISIPSGTWSLFQKKAASAGVTSFSLLTALISKAVGRYVEEPEFVMNIPVTSRMIPVDGLMDAVGMYSDFALVPVDLRIHNAFQLAEKIGSEILEQQFGGLSGLDRLTLWRQNNPHASAPVVFTSVDDGSDENTIFHRTFLRTQTSQTWLEMLLCPLDGRIYLEAICQPSRIPVEAAENVLKTVLEEIDQIVSPKKAEKNLTCVSVDLTLKQWMERGFADHKGESLLLWSHGRKSYEETWTAASGLCRKLQSQDGFEPGKTRIGILLPKGPLQAVASFAATMAGAAFLPLDLDYPVDTMRSVVERAGLSMLIVQEETEAGAALCGVPCLRIDETMMEGNEEQPVSCYDWKPEEIALIINTSGTTGEPKSAALKAEGLVNCFIDSMSRFSLSSGVRCITVTNFCHDMAIFDLYGLLACGGAIVFPDSEQIRNPSHWVDLMNRFHVTFWNSVPAFMEMLAADEQNLEEALRHLKTVTMGGDFIPVSLAAQLLSAKPSLNVFSVGGPTETTIWNISHKITWNDIEEGTIPYGRAFQNTTYYILNAAGQEVPDGVIGEMCVAGAGVSAGYLGIPEETDRKFEFRDGQRIYHTGDYGYRRKDGNLVIQGRHDGQVKINGKRIELGGIENQLSGHREVSRAVVVRKERSGKLHAYYTGSRELSERECKSFLEQQLPSYMIPSGFSYLEQFPLTRNGKVDRKLLTSREEEMMSTAAQTSLESSGSDKADEIEFGLIAMCSELFPGEVIDEDLNFYAIGGDSIQAIRLLSMIKKEFHVTLSAYDILEEPFLSAWAEKIREKTENAKNPAADLTRLAEETVGVENGVLLLTEGVEEKLSRLSRELERRGIRKNRYELLANPYLQFDSDAGSTSSF